MPSDDEAAEVLNKRLGQPIAFSFLAALVALDFRLVLARLTMGSPFPRGKRGSIFSGARDA